MPITSQDTCPIEPC